MSGRQRGIVAAGVTVVVAAILVTGAYFSLAAQGGTDDGGFGSDERAAWRSEHDASLRVLGGKAGVFDAPVAAHDLDGDGKLEFIVPSEDRSVYVYGEDGTERAKLPSRYPPSWHVESVLNPVEVTVLGEGQEPTLVVANAAAYVTAWTLDGSSGKELTFAKAWEHRLDDCHKSPGMDAGVTLVDVDGDGYPEIFIQTEEQGLYGLNGDGTTRWKHCWAGGNGAAAADDLDGDGTIEVVFASDDGLISVFDGDTGAAKWTFNAADPDYGIKPASISVAPTIAELDGESPKEILFTARHAPRDDPDRFEDFHMAIFAVHESAKGWEGELVWMRQPEWANPLSYTRLVVEDVDGDGRADVFGMDWNTVGHRPGDWERLNSSTAFRLDADGEDVWVRSIDAWWSNKDILVGDFDGDGEADVLVNGPGNGGDGMMRLDAADGGIEGFLGAGSWKLTRAPVPVTFADGSLGLVAPAEPDDDEPRGALLVYNLGFPAKGGGA